MTRKTNMRLSIFVVTSLLTWGMISSRHLYAADNRLPAKVRMVVIMKALTYDEALVQRCPNGLRIGVISLAGNDDSKTVAGETISELNSLKATMTVKGLSISTESIEAGDFTAAKNAILDKKINTVYLSAGLGGMLGSLIDFCREKKILVLTGEADQVRAGAAIGAVQRNNKPQILVNLQSAIKQGSDLDARLLRLAEIVQ